jgi:2-polyprenyl-6-hydroxyphenyl methylase/3-demethylubiquinone-9 3-methyltransferase
MSHDPSVSVPSVGTTGAHAAEVANGERFEFGSNWAGFLSVLDLDRIAAAERGLQDLLEIVRLDGVRFLDIGSGSGLSSLAARRLGASVHSFDNDPQSVACTRELRRRFFPADPDWTIESGSVLDGDTMLALGEFDIVYSWGVLHHTGRMWDALAHAAIPVAEGGTLAIAIYNDMGSQSRRWRMLKKTYNELPRPARVPFAIAVTIPAELKALAGAALRLRPADYLRSWTDYRRRRGMSRWHDVLDWVGGYPYECATPEAIFDFYRSRGFSLAGMKCGGVGLGCNEFVFARTGARAGQSVRSAPAGPWPQVIEDSGPDPQRLRGKREKG